MRYSALKAKIFSSAELCVKMKYQSYCTYFSPKSPGGSIAFTNPASSTW